MIFYYITSKKALLKTSFYSYLLAASLLSGQNSTHSPYSRYGLGNYSNRLFSANVGLGSSYIALRNDNTYPLYINPGNPASYTSIKKDISYEVGLNSDFNFFSDKSVKQFRNNTGLNYLALAFPIRKSMGASFGVMTASKMGYYIYDKYDVSNIGTVKELYIGDGGLNQFYLGYAVQPFQMNYQKFRNKVKKDSTHQIKETRSGRVFRKAISSLSLGGNAYYMFGTLSNEAYLLFPNSSGIFNTKRNSEITVGDFTGSFGLQFSIEIDSLRKCDCYLIAEGKPKEESARCRKLKKCSCCANDTSIKPEQLAYRKIRKDLKKNVFIDFGYVASVPNALKATSNFSYTSFNLLNTSQEIPYTLFPGYTQYEDTIVTQSNVKGTIKMPFMHGFGMSVRKGTSFLATVQGEMQLWSKFKLFNDESYLKDAFRINAGLQFIPDKEARAYHKKIIYRAGFKYDSGSLELNGNKISDMSVSLGFSLPIDRYRLRKVMNLSLEAGKIGTLNTNLIQQQYIRAVLSFTFNDTWFIKYKYD